MFKPKVFLPLNINYTKADNKLLTEGFRNKPLDLLEWFGINLDTGNSNLVLSQLGIWIDNTNSCWKLLGNSNINDTINFLGTTNNKNIVFKRNNLEVGKLTSDNVSFGLGTSASGTSVAIGSGSQASSEGVAIGETALAVGTQSIAIGTLAIASGAISVAIGSGATAGLNSIALGASTAGTNQFTIPFGITDVQFNGAVITTAGSVNTSTHTDKVRVVSASGVVTLSLTTDYIVVINKTVGATTAVSLPHATAIGQTLIIKDGKGDANTNNITITSIPAPTNNIDGAGNYVISNNYGSITLIWNGTEWNSI